MIEHLESEILAIASEFSFIQKSETLLKTPNTIKIKLTISSICFVQVYRNIAKNISNYVLVSGSQRLFGRDCDGGKWHCHPVEDPESHDFSEDGCLEVSLNDFLYEVAEKLLVLGIL
jgi:hypothetical protein